MSETGDRDFTHHHHVSVCDRKEMFERVPGIVQVLYVQVDFNFRDKIMIAIR